MGSCGDFLDVLGPDVSFEVLKHFNDPSDYVRITCVSRSWRQFGWEDIYKVLVAMLPLYFALRLGYGSVRWWGIFTPEHCEAINPLVSFFTLPLFTFGFTAHSDPFQMNYRFIAADVLSKVVIVVVLSKKFHEKKGEENKSWCT
ncbi:hypothetical protein ACLOJK_001754 [Asimina triloba]